MTVLAPLGQTTPRLIAESMLTLAAEALEALEAGGTPPVSYVSHGEPTAPDPTDSCDNEQLTAHLVRLRPKLVNDTQGVNRRNAFISWVAEMALVLFRCVPLAAVEGEISPPSADLDTAYGALLDEGTAIARHFSRQYFADAWDELASCQDVGFGALEPIAPLGGVAGWRLTLSAQL